MLNKKEAHVSLSTEDRQEIIRIIKETHTRCACGLSNDSQREVGHFFGRLKDLGKGNLNEGIEMFSRAIGLVIVCRRYGERAGGAIATFILVSIVGGLGWLMASGLKRWLQDLTGGG
jgi:hypothetical protein